MNDPYSTTAGAASEPWQDLLWSMGDYPYISAPQSSFQDSVSAPGQLFAAEFNPHNSNVIDDMAFSPDPITSVEEFTRLLNYALPVSKQTI
jgi:hypothetical protein